MFKYLVCIFQHFLLNFIPSCCQNCQSYQNFSRNHLTKYFKWQLSEGSLFLETPALTPRCNDKIGNTCFEFGFSKSNHTPYKTNLINKSAVNENFLI